MIVSLDFLKKFFLAERDQRFLSFDINYSASDGFFGVTEYLVETTSHDPDPLSTLNDRYTAEEIKANILVL